MHQKLETQETPKRYQKQGLQNPVQLKKRTVIHLETSGGAAATQRSTSHTTEHQPATQRSTSHTASTRHAARQQPHNGTTHGGAPATQQSSSHTTEHQPHNGAPASQAAEHQPHSKHQPRSNAASTQRNATQRSTRRSGCPATRQRKAVTPGTAQRQGN